MSRSSRSRRSAWLFLFLPLAILAGASGFGCPPIFDGGVIVEDFVTFELINETPFEVDTGIFIDDFLVDFGEFNVLLPFEAAPLLDVECIPGDVITIDAILLDPVDPLLDVPSANVPVLVEGFDYFCGDLITVFYTQDAVGTFFVDVAVNDILLGF